MDGKHTTESVLTNNPVLTYNRLELIDYMKLADMEITDIELMGYAIGILINRFNALATIHNNKMDEEDSLL